jgi:hypothetical protein
MSAPIEGKALVTGSVSCAYLVIYKETAFMNVTLELFLSRKELPFNQEVNTTYQDVSAT